ncbi:MAG: amidase [Burkholderiaceae bacterium]
MNEWLDAPLVDAARAIAGKQISSRELTLAGLARAEKLNPGLNAFISLDPEGALAQADAADNALAQGKGKGKGPGLLHGVPLAHKDMFYRVGKVSTCGSKILKDFVPDITSTALSRLEDAGALHLGGLSMAEFAFSGTGHNHHYGAVRNAWNPAHISGGSSSGSGASTGARIVFGALGSDTGGSIRLPAAANGVYGIKPTQTRVSRYGAMGLSFSLDTVGPLARTARDCARLLGVIAGHDPLDGTSSRHPVADYEAACVNPDIKGMRIGVPTNYYYDGADPEVRDRMHDSLKVLADLGAHIIDVEVPLHDCLSDLANVVMASEAATLHGAWLRERPDDYGPQVKARIENGFAFTATQYLSALQRRPQITAEFIDQVFSRCDVLHTPTLNVVLPTIAETDVGAAPGFASVLGRVTHCSRPVNYLGLPSLAVPAGFTIGQLPASFQLIGRPFDEASLFRVGAAYEAATTWTTLMPSLIA